MAAAQAPAILEDFWEDLLAAIESRRVIPVIGAELLTVEIGGVSLPLYRTVAERLLARYGTRPEDAMCRGMPLRQNHELNDAVCAIAFDGRRRVREFYRPVHDILQKTVAESSGPPKPLKELAAISAFDLYLTTTPDDLLAQALNAVRYAGSPRTYEIEYAPKLPTDRARDIPASTGPGFTAVFYLFGKSDAAPLYAIHEEDALEFPYELQAKGQPERVLSLLRDRDLLLIGCTFADWLSRLLLRLSNKERLFSDQRVKKEFLVGEQAASDPDFTIFLDRFSRDTRYVHFEPRKFVTELHQRCQERNLITASQSHERRPQNTIFLSYAREDAVAARRLYEELELMGGGVAWLDKTMLAPGDKWEDRIREAIRSCKLFVPLISSNTERRDEGYFRREWYEAIERSKGTSRKFIVPVVVDPYYTGDTHRYSAFLDHHYGFAPNGWMTPELRSELKEQLREIARRAAAS